MDTDRDPNYPNVWQCIGLTLMLVIISLVGMIFLTSVRKGAGPTTLDTLMVTLMATGVVIFWGYDRAGLPFRQTFPFNPFPLAALFPILIATVGVSIVVSEMDNALRWLAPVDAKQLESMRKAAEEVLHPSKAMLVLAVLVAPLGEEMIFRGLILRGLLNRFRQDHAIAGSAVLFALVHVDPYRVITVFFVGLFLAWIFTRTGSLWACVLAHATANGMGWVVVSLLGVTIPGYSDLPGETVVFQPPWFDALGVVCLAAGGYFIWRATRDRACP